MNGFDVIAVLIAILTAVAYINYNYIKMQSTIALLVAGLLTSCILILLQKFAPLSFVTPLITAVKHMNFNRLVYEGLLNYLLFAGAMQIDWHEMKKQLMNIAFFSLITTSLSTLIIAWGFHLITHSLSAGIPWAYCLLFGALISPTDPIAVIANMIALNAPKKITTLISSEALFNDGIAIVLFTLIANFTLHQTPLTLSNIFTLFFHQSVLGLLFGGFLGIVGNKLIESIDDTQLKIMLSIALVTVGYRIALYYDISGPLAMVITGLFISHKNKKKGRDTHKAAAQQLNNFWLLIDELLNAALFFLVGIELITFQNMLSQSYLLFLAVILLTLLGRTLSILLTQILLRSHVNSSDTAILIWGGLRGGLTLALALSIPQNNPYYMPLTTLTFVVVIFSIIVQGASVKKLIKTLA